jgi:hypothetical protein
MDVALGFLNNLAYTQAMRPVYQFGGYIGTFGEYTNHALRTETALRRDEPGGGASSCEVLSRDEHRPAEASSAVPGLQS